MEHFLQIYLIAKKRQVPYTYKEMGESCVEFLIINGNKLKISLSSEEIEKYAISDDEKANEGPEVRKSIWRILDTARDGCGFDASGEKVLVQFYKTHAGGEMFVTKLGKLTSSTEKTLSASTSVTMLTSRAVIYSFAELNDLIEAVKRIPPSALEKCSLYCGDNGVYYIVGEERTGRSKLSEISVFSEYGEELPASLVHYVVEHSVKAFDNGALSALAGF